MKKVINYTSFKIIGLRMEKEAGWHEFSTDQLDFNNLDILVRALTFSGRYGHLLNNGISGVLGYLSVLSEEDSGNEVKVKKEDIDALNESANELNRRISGLNLYRKVWRLIEISADEATLDLADFIRSAVDSEEKNYKIDIFKYGFSGELNVSMKCSPEIFMEILRILIGNAVRALDKDEKKVEISFKKERNGVVLEVKDNGRGIKEEDLPLIFLPGYIAKDDPDFITGMGMGLTVALMVVKNMGGRIVVRSKPGAGSVFIVYIPFSGKFNLVRSI